MRVNERMRRTLGWLTSSWTVPPQALADLEKELKFVTEAANRWTDNIFNCQTYLVKKRNLDKKAAQKMLAITDTFDCKLLVFSSV